MNSSLGGRHYVHSSSSAHIQTISTLPFLVYLYSAPPQLSLWYALFCSYPSWWLPMKTSASFCHKKIFFTYNALSVTLNCWPWVFELIHLYYLYTLHLHQSTCLSILSWFCCVLFLSSYCIPPPLLPPFNFSLLLLQTTMSSTNITVHRDCCLTSSVSLAITVANKKGLRADP